MKNNKRHLILYIVTALLAGSIYATPLRDQNKTDLRNNEELVFVSQPNLAPIEFIHKKNASGMNIELIQWMAADMGFKSSIVIAPQKRALEMIKYGEADAMTSLFLSDSSKANLDLSKPLKTTPTSLYIHNDRTDISGINDLEGKKVAIMGSEHAIEVLQSHNVQCEILFLSSIAECVDLVRNQKADAMIGNELITRHYMYSSGKADLKIIDEPLFTTSLCIAVKKGNTGLLKIINKGIVNAKKSGTLYKIQTKWLGTEYSRKTLPLRAILLTASIALFFGITVILFVLYWNRKLQKKVATQTQQYVESEERLRQIFENSPDAVLVVDREGQIITANARACKSVKMTKQELLGKKIHDLTPEESKEEVDSSMDKWFSGKISQREGENVTADGSTFPVEMTGALQNIRGKRVLQLHIRDITLRKEAEEKMNTARKMAENAKEMAERARAIAEHASKAKSEFLANMSHEIRTPLNGIVGMAQLIADTDLDEEQNNCVETILQSTTGLLQIINHVLDISKIEAGQMDVKENTIDLHEMCKNLQKKLQPLADQKELKFKCECQEAVPFFMIGDESLINQVLENLVENALKFTHKGSVTLNIECHKKSADGAELYFQIIDTGIGIPKEKHALVFDKFMQNDSSSKRLYGGTGLGLAISKQLIELMGGKIGLISSTGRGSTFFFNLTLPQASHPATISLEEKEKIQTQIKPGMKILLAEDNHVNQKVAVAILRKAGCEVDLVENGQDAIQKIKFKQYDIVLMDCQMPIMDGFEATTRIRAMQEPTCSTTIIAITAHAMKDDKQKCINGGMNDYISKPVNRQELINLINKYSDNS